MLGDSVDDGLTRVSSIMIIPYRNDIENSFSKSPLYYRENDYNIFRM